MIRRVFLTARLLTLFAGLLLLLTSPVTCRASLLYGIELSAGTGFFGVNQASGALTLVGPTGNSATGDLTSNFSSQIWTVDMVNASLVSVDPVTGAVAGTTLITVSLAWNPVTQLLYGNTAVGFGSTSNDQLYQIDPATGVATLAGTIGFNAVYALGFDNSGTLYGISNSAQMMTIDTTTGAGTFLAPVGLTAVFDLAFRPEDNAMFVADSGSYALYTVNPVSGAATLVGPYGSANNLVGLAFVGATPEPGTIGLLLGGLGLLGWKVRKRR
jgi:hypothetical protein